MQFVDFGGGGRGLGWWKRRREEQNRELMIENQVVPTVWSRTRLWVFHVSQNQDNKIGA